MTDAEETSVALRLLTDSALAARIRALESGERAGDAGEYATLCSAAIDRFLLRADLDDAQRAAVHSLRN